MSERKRNLYNADIDNQPPVKGRFGHPSVQELMTEQGTGPLTDVSKIHGEFWPEEESIEEFLDALHSWRGHNRNTPAA